MPGTKAISHGCHGGRRFSFSMLPRARIAQRIREGGLESRRVLDRHRPRLNDHSSRKCVPPREILPCPRGS